MTGTYPRLVPSIALILLTHATIPHLGAYAHCCKHFPLFGRIPVYATAPVISLGRALLQDLYTSNPPASSTLPFATLTDLAYSLQTPVKGEYSNILLPPPSNEEIAGYFSRIHSLKYSQPHQPTIPPFSNSLEDLTITAYTAGHTIGGTIWHIQHQSESVIYAVDWNQAKENTLSGAAWLGAASSGGQIIEQLRQPTSLVCSSKGARGVGIEGGWKNRDDILLGHIRDVVKDGGTVLIPSDCCARAVELAFVLEQAWIEDSDGTLRHAKLFMTSRSSSAVKRYTQNIQEWMDETTLREYESKSNVRNSSAQPSSKDAQSFEFKHLKALERKSQIDSALNYPGPKVFLASDWSIQWGFSRDIVTRICDDRKNLVILTNRPSAKDGKSNGYLGPNANPFLATMIARSSANEVHSNIDQTFEVTNNTTTGLEQEELQIYQQYLARHRQRANALDINDVNGPESGALDDQSSSSSSDSEESDTGHQGRALNTSANLNHSKRKLGLSDAELGVNVLLRRKNVYDYDVRDRKGRERMFPFFARKSRFDNFGYSVRPEDYISAYERDEANIETTQKEAPQLGISKGQKRRWDNRDDSDKNSKISQDSSKRRKNNDTANHGQKLGSIATADFDTEIDASGNEFSEPRNLGPHKIVASLEPLRFKCKLSFVDYSGVHDKRALQMLIPLIRPQKLVLTGGTESETSTLASDCRGLLQKLDPGRDSANIYSPRNGESVDASAETKSWTLKINQSLWSQLKWQNVRDLRLVTLSAQITGNEVVEEHEDEKRSKRPKIELDSTSDEGKDYSRKLGVTLPILNTPSAGSENAGWDAEQTLLVGDVRLPEVRRIMQAQGHSVEFKGEGTLLVDGLVIVRKSGIGKIDLLYGGAIGYPPPPMQTADNFLDVKRRIYDGLAVITAS